MCLIIICPTLNDVKVIPIFCTNNWNRETKADDGKLSKRSKAAHNNNNN